MNEVFVVEYDLADRRELVGVADSVQHVAEMVRSRLTLYAAGNFLQVDGTSLGAWITYADASFFLSGFTVNGPVREITVEEMLDLERLLGEEGSP